MSREEWKARERTRTVISYLFSFILSMFLLLMTVCLASLNILFSEGFFCRVIGDEYYQSVLSEIVTQAEDYTLPVGFDVSVLDGVFTIDDVRHDVNGHITAAYRGYQYTPDMETENNRLYANISASLEEDHVDMEGDVKDIIDAYVKDIDGIYLGEVPMPGIALIKAAREKVKGIVSTAAIVLFVLSLALSVVLVKLYKYPHHGLQYVTYAAGGCTLMSFGVPFYLWMTRVYARVFVTPEYFYVFVSEYLKQVLESFMRISLLWLLITVACGVYIYLSRNGWFEKKGKGRWQKKLQALRRRRA